MFIGKTMAASAEITTISEKLSSLPLATSAIKNGDKKINSDKINNGNNNTMKKIIPSITYL